jgi:hypothetical protein
MQICVFGLAEISVQRKLSQEVEFNELIYDSASLRTRAMQQKYCYTFYDVMRTALGSRSARPLPRPGTALYLYNTGEEQSTVL